MPRDSRPSNKRVPTATESLARDGWFPGRSVSMWLALAVLAFGSGCGAIPGNTSRSTRPKQVRYLLVQAQALERQAVEAERQADVHERAAEAYDQRAGEAKDDLARHRRAKGREAKARCDTAQGQIGFFQRAAKSERSLEGQFRFEAKKLRIDAARTRREARRIEKFTPDPIYEPEETPKYGAM